MRKQTELSSQFRPPSEDRPKAVLVYDEIERQRKSGLRDNCLEHLSLLAPFMPNLDKSDLTIKDKKCIYMMYINILAELGDFTAALSCSAAALNFDDRDTKTIAKRASLLRQLGRNDDSIDSYHRGLRINSTDKDLLTGLGLVYLATGDETSALVYLKRAKKIDPNDRLVRTTIREIESSAESAPSLTAQP